MTLPAVSIEFATTSAAAVYGSASATRTTDPASGTTADYHAATGSSPTSGAPLAATASKSAGSTVAVDFDSFAGLVAFGIAAFLL